MEKTNLQSHDFMDKTCSRETGTANIPHHEEEETTQASGVHEKYQGQITMIKNGVLKKLSTPVLSKSIDCKRKPDRTSPRIFDVVHMSVNGMDTLIVADHPNRCIKSFFTRRNRSCHSRLEVPGSPCRIARIEGNKLAVTLEDTFEILTFMASPDLSMLSSIPVSKSYIGLTALTPTTFAACPRYSLYVDIIDLTGNILRSIRLEGRNHDPLFLCTTEQGLILVSDIGTRSVYCLTPQGDVVFKYYHGGQRSLVGVNGIACTEMGDILVADGRDGKVIHLTELGKFVGEILTSHDGLKEPYILDYDNGNIYVSYDGIEQVQVFTLT